MEESKLNIGPEMAKALGAFQAECPPVTYNKKVDFNTKAGRVFYQYSTLDHLMATVREPLKNNGLAFTQLVNEDASVTTILMHTSGEWVAGTCRIPFKSDDPKAVGATISYAKRYGLSAILGVCAEEDDENVAHSPANSSKEFRAKQAKAAPASNPAPSNGKATPNGEGLDANIVAQIEKAKEVPQLMTILKEIQAQGIEKKPYLPLLSSRKAQLLNNAN